MSQDVKPPKSNSILLKNTKFLGTKAQRAFLKRCRAPHENSGKKGSTVRGYSEVRTSRAQFLCAKIRGQNTKRNFATRTIYKLNDKDSHILLAFISLVITSAIFEDTRGEIICGGFRSINAHAEQERSELS